MSPSDWRSVLALFEAAKEEPEAQRREWIAAADSPPNIIAEALILLDDELDQTGPAPGRTYGRYTILASIGRGGMGEVFSAKDQDLGRRVALKFVQSGARFLPEAAERLVREARSASALSHPNLVTVHEVLHSGTDLAIVTELIEGESLRHFCGSPISLKRVAKWGAQVARGLAAAHERGIVHGDIKPENVMVRADGYVKVLDFGLAQRDGAAAISSGMPFGSIGYMSPEQIQGEPLTPATDVFSLGVVMLELVTGKHPFLEATSSATTKAIHERDALAPSRINPRLATGKLAAILRPMLEKRVDLRPDMATVALQLESIRTGDAPGAGVLLAAAAATIILCASGWWFFRSRTTGPIEIIPVTDYAGVEAEPAISTDGTQVAFVWSGLDDRKNIYLKSFDRDDLRRLSNSAREDSTPVWSPDGKSIAYVERNSDGGDEDLLVMPVAGGFSRLIGKAVDRQAYRGLAWWPDSGSLIVRDAIEEGKPLVRLFLDGRKVPLTRPAGEQDCHPIVSPDGKTLAFTRVSPSKLAICVMPLGGKGEICKNVRANVSTIAWLADSRRILIGGRAGVSLFSPDGTTTPVLDGAVTDIDVNPKTGRAVIARASQDVNIWKLDTASRRSTKFIASSKEDSEPDFSPDGQSIVFRSDRSGTQELYVCDRNGENLRQLTKAHGELGSARWSPDGRSIAFDGSLLDEGTPAHKTASTNIYVVNTVGGEPRRLTDDKLECMVPGWSRDGRWIYFTKEVAGNSRELWKVPAAGGMQERVAGKEMFDIIESEDGQSLYFGRPRNGAPGVWRWKLAGGGDELVPGTEEMVYRSWDLHAGLLFFQASGFRILDLQTGRVVEAGPPPKGLFNGPRNISGSPDGKTILYTQLDLTIGDLYRFSVANLH